LSLTIEQNITCLLSLSLLIDFALLIHYLYFRLEKIEPFMENCIFIQQSRAIYPGRDPIDRSRRFSAVCTVLLNSKFLKGDIYLSKEDLLKIPKTLKTQIYIINYLGAINLTSIIAIWIFY
jgi:hypothetical protein